MTTDSSNVHYITLDILLESTAKAAKLIFYALFRFSIKINDSTIHIDNIMYIYNFSFLIK